MRRFQPPNVRARIMELLSDGKPRLTQEIADEIHTRFGFSILTVRAEMSLVAWLRYIDRVRIGKTWQYWRNDIEAR
jgi:hypothetical protein